MESIISLAYSMYTNKGVYALLLGSGISRSAGIPTGWEVTLDLIKQMAILQGEQCEANLEKWYMNKYGKQPDYSDLLDEMAKTPTERQQLLKKYFEATEEEREEGIKAPTVAHRAIAKLVKKGYIKIIITTNFDRLLEDALKEEGITPNIISNKDNLLGAMPYIHTDCTIIKVHGDYMDTRIKNTVNELETYEPEMNKLLDRVFDEFGMIICGWSGEWDIALRNTFQRCINHRFTTYWTSIGEPAKRAKELIENRKAQVINISGADSFFQSIKDKIEGLEGIDVKHPLSNKIAIATVKKYSVKAENRIRLHDFVIEETKRTVRTIRNIYEKYSKQQPTVESVRSIVEEYNNCIEMLLHICAYGCYWGTTENVGIWIKSVELISECVANNGYQMWIKLSKYPIYLMTYIIGISSLASGNLYNFISLIKNAKIANKGKFKYFLEELTPYHIFGDDADRILNKKNYHTPVNDYVYEKLENILVDVVGSENNYEYYFDCFEYLYELIYIDCMYSDIDRVWTPRGRYAWKYKYSRDGLFINEIEQVKDKLIDMQLFKGDINRLNQIKEVHDKLIKNSQF